MLASESGGEYMAGFTPVRDRKSGGAARVIDIVVKDTDAAANVGDIVNLESGEIDLGATNDTAFLGVIVGHSDPSISLPAATVDSVTKLRVALDPVMSVTDANARLIGDTLDISGATGAMTVATSSNVDLVVMETSSATEPTVVRFVHAELAAINK